eukprot:NODE_1505_length_954_cov_994.253039_g1045_i0.p2 GENE.NODE_1505_length_954_cov_994.253039_g1045_i0~~NODE_1505_length_954_cov_994.253039_g1045_i0.p2  ORF type:complete len:255 (+),score=96.56 NODE_1505_length_954_cov_994.253039_g1045_i0:57-821(+)
MRQVFVILLLVCIASAAKVGTLAVGDCLGSPANPTNGGFANCTVTANAGICPLTCNSGYLKKGDAVCTNATWVTTNALCDPVVAPGTCFNQPLNPNMGAFEPSCVTRPPGSTCRLVCAKGYTASPTTVTCTNGQWATGAVCLKIAETTSEWKNGIDGGAMAGIIVGSAVLALLCAGGITAACLKSGGGKAKRGPKTGANEFTNLPAFSSQVPPPEPGFGGQHQFYDTANQNMFDYNGAPQAQFVPQQQFGPPMY